MFNVLILERLREAVHPISLQLGHSIPEIPAFSFPALDSLMGIPVCDLFFVPMAPVGSAHGGPSDPTVLLP